MVVRRSDDIRSDVLREVSNPGQNWPVIHFPAAWAGGDPANE
jgi:hypothetical protein